MTEPQLLPGEDIAAWGARTGRYAHSEVPRWRAQIDQERRRIIASGGNPDVRPMPTESTIPLLFPALAGTTAVTASAGATLTDAEYTALFHPERLVRASYLDDPEYRALYGKER